MLYGFGRLSLLGLVGVGAGDGACLLVLATEKRQRRLGMGKGVLSLSAVVPPLEVRGLLLFISPSSEGSVKLGGITREGVKDL